MFLRMNMSPSNFGLRAATIRSTVFPVWFDACDYLRSGPGLV